MHGALRTFAELRVVFAVVVAVLGLLQGGRYQRLVALLWALSGAVNLLGAADWDPTDASDYLRYGGVQAAFLIVYLWLAARHRPPWLLALAAFEAVHVIALLACALDVRRFPDLEPLFVSLSFAKSLCLASAVSWRWLAPPRALPAAGAADVDLYAIAAARWPGKVGAPRPR